VRTQADASGLLTNMALQIGVLVLLATVLYVLHKNFGRALWETLKKRLSKVAPGRQR
jgi:hypothetical protein